MSKLYDNIDELCKKKGISVLKMCKEIGISKSNVYDVKYGIHEDISRKTAEKIAGYFEITVDELYTGIKKEPPTMDGKTFEMVTLLNQLTTENMAKALDYIQYLLSTQR